MDCDWFSNELLPPPNLPDRHASSGGCFRDGRGFGAAEARGTARWRKLPGADHFPDFGPHDGGNGREGLAITAERGRGASVTARRVQRRLSAGRSHGSGAPRPGGREKRRTRHFSRLLVRVVFRRRRGRGTPARRRRPRRFRHTRTAGSTQRPGRTIRGDRGPSRSFVLRGRPIPPRFPRRRGRHAPTAIEHSTFWRDRRLLLR